MSVLTRVMARPESLGELSPRSWDDLLILARDARVLARLHGYVEDRQLQGSIPVAAAEVLQSARIYADYRQLLARGELHKLGRLFADCDYPVVLLKGAAYLMAQLAPGVGRRLNDIDLLVPEEKLAETEARLVAEGWGFEEELSEYDERYYREWSHEIPPLRHSDSALELDVHHNLIQSIGRKRLDARRLFEQVVPLPGTPFSVLSPADMVLHSAAHLFMSDELRGGLRDLVDMQLLCEHFSAQDERYWQILAERAEELGLQRPLYYAITSMRRLLVMDIPEAVYRRIAKHRPAWLADQVMTRAIDSHLAPESPSELSAVFASNLLYIRSHWIRMPPLMLVRHLSYKFWLGLRGSGNT